MKYATALLLALLVAGLALSAQVPPPPTDQGPPIRVEVDLVNIVFSVVDRRYRHVAGLGPDDFLVYEDGVPQKIRYFSSESNLPLRIGLVVDMSNSVRPRFQYEQEAAIDFLHTVLRPKTDRAFLLAFDATPSLVQDFTDDPLALSGAIRALRAGGGTALYDAIFLAAKRLGQTARSDQRKMLIVLGDGDDNQSVVSFTEALEMAQRHEVVIFTVSTSAPPIKYSGESVKFRNPCEVLGEQGDKILQRFAEETGGTPYCPFDTLDVGRSFEQIVNELRNQYTLAYTPTNRVRDGRFRHITIETRRKGLRVNHRPGYYATPLPEASVGSPGSR
ncbi:MAG: VWA domain-containing protein [Acidobacteria bacterium]|nr:VWA domain-containing protein [Acidobacteriota bacterium]